MSTLLAKPFPWQEPDIDGLEHILSHWDVALDSSDPGTGKTWKACFLAQRLRKQIAVVCPKSIIPVWHEVAEKVGVTVTHITNYEKLRAGKTPLGTWIAKRKFKWDLPENCLLIVDEVHRAKGQRTKNCDMMMAIRESSAKALLLSATAAQNPLEMKALGYLLDLHQGRNFISWCKNNGCKNGYFGGLEYVGGTEGLKQIHESIRSRMVRTRITDLGSQFPENQVQTLPLETGEADAIDKAILDELNQLESGAETELVAGLRARQKAEYLKAKAIASLTSDMVAENRSVAIFVCFKQTLNALKPIAEKLNGEEVPCIVQGGQTGQERQEAIDAFQQDKSRVILCMIQAGGVGLSLHDTNGTYPRVALICPSFSATDLRQSLGRIHRAGAKSPAQQFIVFAANTIEETVRSRVESKLRNIDLLNDGDLVYTSPQSTMPKPTLKTTETLPHSERAHAPLSPSGLAYLERCPGFQRDEFAQMHPVTLRGTAMHEAAESGDYSQLDEEENELVEMCRSFTDQLQAGRPNAHIQMEAQLQTHLNDCWGTCDWLLVEGDQGIICDYKFGYKLVDDPKINAQAAAYTLGLFLREEQVQEIDFYFLIPRCDSILKHTFKRADVEWLKLRLETIQTRCQAPEKEYSPQPKLCEYCGYRAQCPALMNKVLPLAAKYQGDHFPIPVKAHSSAITDPEDMSRALKLALLLDKWVQSVKHHALTMRLENGIEVPGFELAERAGRRKITNLLAAWDIAQQEGVLLDEFLQICDVSLTKLEDIYASKAPPRKKTHWKQLLADRLTDKEAIQASEPVRYLKAINN